MAVRDPRSQEPLRVFRSDFLELFTSVQPVTVLIVWVPILCVSLAFAVSQGAGQAAGTVPLLFAAGLALWTLLEYTLHRFLFHFPARSPAGKRIVFIFHGVHHAQPLVKTRLVMPPPVSLGLGLLVYLALSLFLGLLLGRPSWVPALFAGVALGYLWYDMTHYATHHFRLRSRAFQYLRRYHLHHHGQTPNARFGVSSPLWDIVFGTKPEA